MSLNLEECKDLLLIFSRVDGAGCDSCSGAALKAAVKAFPASPWEDALKKIPIVDVDDPDHDYNYFNENGYTMLEHIHDNFTKILTKSNN